jgi:anthranilate phosphoribosyltransferase
MGPFTESFIEALRTTSGEIKEVFETAKKNTMQISPGQEPVLETSDKIEPLILRGKTGAVLSNRAAELLNSAERYYLNRDWAPFMETMERARTLAMSGPLYDRLDVEIKFSHNVMAAEDEMNKGQWTEAAANWLKAANLFPARRWVLLNAALALTLTDKIEDSIPILRKLSVGEDGDVKEKSSKLLKELLAAIPELRQLESADLEVSTPSKSIEFEKVAERE